MLYDIKIKTCFQYCMCYLESALSRYLIISIPLQITP